jgi:hypothetical protein
LPESNLKTARNIIKSNAINKMKSKRLDLLLFFEQLLMTKGKLILEGLKTIDLRRRNTRTKKVYCKKRGEME